VLSVISGLLLSLVLARFSAFCASNLLNRLQSGNNRSLILLKHRIGAKWNCTWREVSGSIYIFIYEDGAKTMLCSVCIACHYVVLNNNVSLEDFHHMGGYGGTVPVFGVGITVVLVGQGVLVLALP
jgi:hypothetical protein